MYMDKKAPDEFSDNVFPKLEREQSISFIRVIASMKKELHWRYTAPLELETLPLYTSNPPDTKHISENYPLITIFTNITFHQISRNIGIWAEYYTNYKM